MASSSSSASFLLFFLFTSSILLQFSFPVIKAQNYPPLADGLSWDFYKESCSDLESYIRDHLKKVFQQDTKVAPSLLHLQFQDCFGQGGCQGKVLLDKSRSGTATFQIIEDLREIVHSKCGRIVSCADIVTLAARESVYLSGGPQYSVPLGRKDAVPSKTMDNLSFSATKHGTSPKLHAAITNADTLLEQFGEKDLDAVDAVSLLGGHTFGRSHCNSFTDRLYPTQDPLLENSYANHLKKICTTSNAANLSVLDVRTPNIFDNKYYVNLLRHQGLLAIDQDLYTDRRTKPIVTGFAYDVNLFFDSFVHAVVKLSQMNVLTGSQGVIRANCLAADLGSSLKRSSLVADN
ncbi:OLC1v1017643C1 [Oldenlandia corymbosa var. corymbosa]|uniref:Peroxidase n=1 Tax=Oldenlandia corymbosa var. corymbosa TaxID=529605 RepID=A0AAV1E9Z7_OLDCO|nr:OLC1v1017643C1 [Oldenlandia corymbosa var. corymbosa]